MSDTLQGFPQLSAPIAEPRTGLINQVWLQLLRALWIRTGAQQGSATFFAGAMQPYAGSAVPSGWIECNGDAISRVDFSVLFSAIGITWGAGDHSTTFNIPDFRNRVFLGSSVTHLLGTYGGDSTATLGTTNLPSHNHGVTDPGHAHTVTDPGHIHAITDPGHFHTDNSAASNVTTGVSAGGGAPGNTGTSGTGISINSHTTGLTVDSNTTGISTQNTGSGTAFSILPPYGACKIIIKT